MLSLCTVRWPVRIIDTVKEKWMYEHGQPRAGKLCTIEAVVSSIHPSIRSSVRPSVRCKQASKQASKQAPIISPLPLRVSSAAPTPSARFPPPLSLQHAALTAQLRASPHPRALNPFISAAPLHDDGPAAREVELVPAELEVVDAVADVGVLCSEQKKKKKVSHGALAFLGLHVRR